jgi:hypothetical protein
MIFSESRFPSFRIVFIALAATGLGLGRLLIEADPADL